MSSRARSAHRILVSPALVALNLACTLTIASPLIALNIAAAVFSTLVFAWQVRRGAYASDRFVLTRRPARSISERVA